MPKRNAGEDACVPQEDETVLSTCERHVKTAGIGEETDALVVLFGWVGGWVEEEI